MQTLVIGGGVVGLACALRLQAAGQQVLLIERDRLAAGASRGNAGALAFTDVLPLASPGILRQAPRWLLDPLGPLSLRARHAPAMLPWLWKFWRASQPGRVAASTQAQAALLRLSAAEWPALLRLAGAEDQVREGGNLHLYDSEAQWRAAQSGWVQRAEHGIAFPEPRRRGRPGRAATGAEPDAEAWRLRAPLADRRRSAAPVPQPGPGLPRARRAYGAGRR